MCPSWRTVRLTGRSPDRGFWFNLQGFLGGGGGFGGGTGRALRVGGLALSKTCCLPGGGGLDPFRRFVIFNRLLRKYFDPADIGCVDDYAIDGSKLN